MIIIEILLGVAAAWALVSVAVLGSVNIHRPTDASGLKFGLAVIDLTLALGFLGLLLK